MYPQHVSSHTAWTRRHWQRRHGMGGFCSRHPTAPGENKRRPRCTATRNRRLHGPRKQNLHKYIASVCSLGRQCSGCSRNCSSYRHILATHLVKAKHAVPAPPSVSQASSSVVPTASSSTESTQQRPHRKQSIGITAQARPSTRQRAATTDTRNRTSMALNPGWEFAAPAAQVKRTC